MVVQTARNESAYRCRAFEYPFLEYIATRTANGMRKALGESILGEPEKLSGVEQVKALVCWPGMKDKVMRDLAEGLAEAGYESFEPEKMKGAIFITKRQEQRMRRERFGGVKD